jgi:hypothetical protein
MLRADPGAFRGLRVGIVISGGNVDLGSVCELFAGG